MIGGVQMKKKKIFDEEVYCKLRTTVSNCDPSQGKAIEILGTVVKPKMLNHFKNKTQVCKLNTQLSIGHVSIFRD